MKNLWGSFRHFHYNNNVERCGVKIPASTTRRFYYWGWIIIYVLQRNCKLCIIQKMKQKTLKSAKEKARKAFKEYIRFRDALSTTGTTYNCVCCTCGKVTRLDGSLHAGHFTQGSHNSTYFEETNVNGQCSTCNRFHHGALDKYLVFMIKKYGQAEVDRLYELNGQIKKYTILDYDEITQKYKEKSETLLKR